MNARKIEAHQSEAPALMVTRAKTPDNVGGWDYAVSAIDPRRDTSEPVVIAEFFEIVGDAKGGGFVKLDARANAMLFTAANDLLEALKLAAARFEGVRAWASADGTKFPALSGDARRAAAEIRNAIAKAEAR
jgi:hypothetical protein